MSHTHKFDNNLVAIYVETKKVNQISKRESNKWTRR